MILIFLYVSVDTGFSQIFKFLIGRNFWKTRRKDLSLALTFNKSNLWLGGYIRSTRSPQLPFSTIKRKGTGSWFFPRTYSVCDHGPTRPIDPNCRWDRRSVGYRPTRAVRRTATPACSVFNPPTHPWFGESRCHIERKIESAQGNVTTATGGDCTGQPS